MDNKHVFLHIPLIEYEKLDIVNKAGVCYIVSTLGRVWKQTMLYPHVDFVELNQEEIEETFKEQYDDGFPDDDYPDEEIEF